MRKNRNFQSKPSKFHNTCNASFKIKIRKLKSINTLMNNSLNLLPNRERERESEDEEEALRDGSVAYL
jgi:hypothetical protein